MIVSRRMHLIAFILCVSFGCLYAVGSSSRFQASSSGVMNWFCPWPSKQLNHESVYWSPPTQSKNKDEVHIHHVLDDFRSLSAFTFL